MVQKDINSSENELVNDTDIRSDFREQYIDEFGVTPSEDELTDYMIDFLGDEGINVVTSNSASDSPFSKMFGILFLIWFIGSLGGLIYFSKVNHDISLIIFGQYFLVFGLIALYNKIPVGWIFFLVGLGIILVPMFIRNPDLLGFDVNWEFLGVFVLGLIFTLVGIVVDFIYLSSNKKLKERCSTLVDATITKIAEDGIPIYEYEFNKRKYRVRGVRFKGCYVTQRVQLMINSSKPREAYFDNKTEKLFMHIFAFFFASAGIFVCTMALLYLL